MVQNLTYHPPLGESDHVILRFNVPFDRSEKVNGLIAKPDVFKTNYEVLKEEMLRYEWDEILTSHFQETYDSFFEILQTALEKHSPIQTPPYKRKNIYSIYRCISRPFILNFYAKNTVVDLYTEYKLK